jgi:hypothetical protein
MIGQFDARDSIGFILESTRERAKGHKPGQGITKRSMKVIPVPACEMRERLKLAYKNSEEGTKKHLNLFWRFTLTGKKHRCGFKLASRS